MVRNKSLPSVSISDLYVGYKASLWRYDKIVVYEQVIRNVVFIILEGRILWLFLHQEDLKLDCP